MKPLELCPFCGGADLKFTDLKFDHQQTRLTHVVCTMCQSLGPGVEMTGDQELDETAAIVMWTRRAGTPTDPAPPPELVPKDLDKN